MAKKKMNGKLKLIIIIAVFILITSYSGSKEGKKTGFGCSTANGDSGNGNEENGDTLPDCYSDIIYDSVNPIVNPENLADGVWTGEYPHQTYTALNQENYLDIIYNKPTGTTIASKWKVADRTGIEELTLPSGCWNQNQLKFRVLFYSNHGDGDYVKWTCWGGNSYIILRTSNYQQAYEQKMIWDSGSC